MLMSFVDVLGIFVAFGSNGMRPKVEEMPAGPTRRMRDFPRLVPGELTLIFALRDFNDAAAAQAQNTLG